MVGGVEEGASGLGGGDLNDTVVGVAKEAVLFGGDVDLVGDARDDALVGLEPEALF